MFLLVKVDGCRNYTVLNEVNRAQGKSLSPYTRSDSNLVTGWYLFQGAAGDRMLDKCVAEWHCGTQYPGWLSGGHPPVADDEVVREVCYNRQTHCCGWTNEIKVKNCSGYYVYKLQETPHNYRYCGNAGAGKLH